MAVPGHYFWHFGGLAGPGFEAGVMGRCYRDIFFVATPDTPVNMDSDLFFVQMKMP